MPDESFAHFAVCFGDLCPAHLGNRGVRRPGHPIVPAGEHDADLERYLRWEGERLRFVTRRHATSTPGLLAAPAATVATLERAVRAYPTQWFFDRWSPARVTA